MWTLRYWKQVAENAVGSFAAGTLSVLGGDAFEVWSVDWRTAVGVGLGATVLSLLKSVVAKTTGDPDSPSLRSKP